MSDISHRSSQFFRYPTEDGHTRVEVRVDGETAWLTQGGLAERYR